MNDDAIKVLDVFNRRLSSFTISHTYSCYQKLNVLGNNDPFQRVRSVELANQFQKIIFDNISEVRILYRHSYGLGGVLNIVFSVPFKKYVLVFCLDIGSLILLNVFSPNENISTYDRLKVIFDERNYFEIECYGEKFIVSNTYLAFEKLSEKLQLDSKKGFNAMLSADFTDYVNDTGKTYGRYGYAQFGKYVIITDFRPEEKIDTFSSKLWVGEEL